MKKTILTLFVCLFSATAFADSAAAPTPTPAAAPFYEQIRLLDSISPYVERSDVPRILVTRKSVQMVIDDMATNLAANKKEVTFQTLRLVQNLIVQYRYSETFFGWSSPRAITSIYTEWTAQDLSDLHVLAQNMISDYGYDDTPYTQITADRFRQMQRLLKQLEDLPLDENFKQQLRALWLPIGETIAIAQLGDRPKTFAKAIPVTKMIQALYPQFDALSSSSTGFLLIQELRGFNEFYAEYAQIDGSGGEE